MSTTKAQYQFMNGVDANKITWIDKLPSIEEEVSSEMLSKFFETMFERQEVWHKRTILKRPAPWTKDPYLRDYKFTNVYRELDRASQWLIKNVLLDHKQTLEDLIFRLIIFRFYNQPDTFNHKTFAVELPYYKDFNSEKLFEQTVRYRKNVGNPWHTAYMMNMAFIKMPPDYVSKYEGGLFKDYAYCKFAFKQVHEFIKPFCKKLVNAEFKTPDELCSYLERLPATSGFQSHEFYIDLCYITKYWEMPVMIWDENDYTNVGPGASLGLRLIFPSLKPSEQKQGIYWLRDLATDELAKHGEYKYIRWSAAAKMYISPDSSNDGISLHQVEMWLCEFSKYMKMQWKVGKQRSKFKMKTITHT